MIGKNYMYTALVFFFIAGLMAELMRTQLFNPNGHVVSLQTYNALVTIHGSIMLYLFAGPIAFAGFANYLVPIMIGAPDMAFPRLNSLSYWFYLFGGTTMLFGFLTASGAAAFGWTGYTPLSTATYSPGPGADLWIASVAMVGFSGIFSAVNLVTTIFYLRAPGMTMFRMPLFVWSMLITGILILIAFPVLTAALVMLYADRHFGAHFFTVSGGGVPVMWQNLFWFFGHPEVYILALPFFGMISEVVPVFSRKPIFGYKGMVFATLAIAGLSTGVWAHHMFTTGTVLLPFFSALSLLIAVPTGIKVFTWIATMWGGQVKFNTSMLFAVGFIAAFVMGHHRRHVGVASDRLLHARHLLRGRTLPPGAHRDDGVRDVGGVLLLVSQVHRAALARGDRQGALLDQLHRLLDHLHASIPAWPSRDAAVGGRVLPQLHILEPCVDGGCVRPRYRHGDADRQPLLVVASPGTGR